MITTVDGSIHHSIKLLVPGSHGGSAPERMVLGSVSVNVLHLASRPVLVVGGSRPRGSGTTRTEDKLEADAR